MVLEEGLGAAVGLGVADDVADDVADEEEVVDGGRVEDVVVGVVGGAVDVIGGGEVVLDGVVDGEPLHPARTMSTRTARIRAGRAMSTLTRGLAIRGVPETVDASPVAWLEPGPPGSARLVLSCSMPVLLRPMRRPWTPGQRQIGR